MSQGTGIFHHSPGNGFLGLDVHFVLHAMKSRLQQVVDPLSSTLAGTGRQGSPFRAFFFSSPSPFASFLPLVFELIESVGGAEASSLFFGDIG